MRRRLIARRRAMMTVTQFGAESPLSLKCFLWSGASICWLDEIRSRLSSRWPSTSALSAPSSQKGVEVNGDGDADGHLLQEARRWHPQDCIELVGLLLKLILRAGR